VRNPFEYGGIFRLSSPVRRKEMGSRPHFQISTHLFEALRDVCQIKISTDLLDKTVWIMSSRKRQSYTSMTCKPPPAQPARRGGRTLSELLISPS
jgi:hypothetical protein